MKNTNTTQKLKHNILLELKEETDASMKIMKPQQKQFFKNRFQESSKRVQLESKERIQFVFNFILKKLYSLFLRASMSVPQK